MLPNTGDNYLPLRRETLSPTAKLVAIVPLNHGFCEDLRQFVIAQCAAKLHFGGGNGTMIKDEAKPHVLVVEDARDIREPLGRYLREHGYRTTTAADALNARKVMKAAAIDLVVLDIM